MPLREKNSQCPPGPHGTEMWTQSNVLSGIAVEMIFMTVWISANRWLLMVVKMF